jgi:hypothetical protein
LFVVAVLFVVFERQAEGDPEVTKIGPKDRWEMPLANEKQVRFQDNDNL